MGLQELLASDQRKTLEFFYVGLLDLCDETVDRHEILYNASVLAHHAQVSTQSLTEMPTPATLSDVFDNHVLDGTLSNDGEMLEAAGAQCLLLAGFFEDQMRGRHQIAWYVELGAGFFHRAAVKEGSRKKAQILHAVARKFEPWRRVHSRLARDLRDLRYLMLLPPMLD